MQVEEWWGREERKARGGIRQHCWEDCTSLPCTGVSSAKTPPRAPAYPCSAGVHWALLTSKQGNSKSSSHKSCWHQPKALLTQESNHPSSVHTEPCRAGQESVNEAAHDAWDSLSLWHTLCCLLAPVSKLVKLVSFVRTKINSHRFSTLS